MIELNTVYEFDSVADIMAYQYTTKDDLYFSNESVMIPKDADSTLLMKLCMEIGTYHILRDKPEIVENYWRWADDHRIRKSEFTDAET